MTKIEGTLWYVQATSRDVWKGKRNVHMRVATSRDWESMEFTYQDEGSFEVKKSKLPEMGWSELASGKVGRLADWQIETEYGIADSSGEVRGDWRPTWVAVAFAMGGVDILVDKRQSLAMDDIYDIVRRIATKGHKIELVPIPDNASRDEEVRLVWEKELQWKKERTGKEVGISPNLTYEGEEEEQSKILREISKKCCIQ